VKVDHLQSDMTEVKASIVALDRKVDAVRALLENKIEALDARIDSVRESLGSRIDALKDSIDSLKVGRWVDRVWWLVIAAGMLGVMARGCKWS
jgi:hypothetical protein